MVHKVDADGCTVDNEFQDGDEDTGVEPTQLLAKWHNMVQRELVNTIEGAGLVLDDANDAQLLAAIIQLAGNGPHATQLGERKTFYRKPAETDYYKFPNGQHLPLPQYQALADALAGDPFLAADDADKTANPGKWRIAGDNTYIAMPDFRGQFERVWHDDLASGGVTRPALGVRKANQNKAHTHGVPEGEVPPGTGSLASGDDYTSIAHDYVDSQSSGGDEAVPDHTAVYVLIRVL